MRRLRCFEQAALNFQYPGRSDELSSLDVGTGLLRPNINLLLGDNGSGKTTILRGIALAVLAPVIEGAGYVPFSLVRRTAERTAAARAKITGQVLLHEQDLGTRSESGPIASSAKPLVTEIIRIHDAERIAAKRLVGLPWERMYDNSSPAFLVVGYGANRRVEGDKTFDSSVRAKSRLLRYDRVAGLFEDSVTLTPLGVWLPSLESRNNSHYTEVLDLINRLLPEDCRFEGKRQGPDYLFQFRGSPVTFLALSDGYRAFIGWVADLLYHICMGCPSGVKLVDNRGIVLVDEIDLHLHPEWQRRVIPDLSAALPNLQFVVTSHSPLVAGTLQAPNIILMEQDPTGATSPRRIDERVHGLSAEQILLGSYFGLKSTRDQETVVDLISLSKRLRNNDPDAAIAFLRRLSGNPPLNADTPAALSLAERSKVKRTEKNSAAPLPVAAKKPSMRRRKPKVGPT
jgi:energy-coupling factor transporter ATP-binding protein EcfA2